MRPKPRRLARALIATRLSCSTIGLVLMFAFSCGANAREPRSASAKREFTRDNPCPATGKNAKRCEGYVVDHVVPLCAGGVDQPTNMQWQTIVDAKAKDRIERQQCRRPT